MLLKQAQPKILCATIPRSTSALAPCYEPMKVAEAIEPAKFIIAVQQVSKPCGPIPSRMAPAFVESFDGRFRDECQNGTLFSTLTEARTVITAWKCAWL